MVKTFSLIALLTFSSLSWSEKEREVVVWLGGLGDPIVQYYKTLIQQALNTQAPEQGRWRIVESPYGHMTQMREQSYLDKGKIHIQVSTNLYNPSSGYSISRINKPTLKGLLGIRSLIVRKSDQHRFKNVKNLEDLQQFTAGLGANWQDVHTLRANGIRVVEGLGVEALFKMLGSGRFDYIPLGVLEDQQTLQSDGQMGTALVILPHVFISYFLPIFIYTSDTIPTLNKHLEQGITTLETTKAFDDIYQEHFGKTLARINASDALVIELTSAIKYSPF